MAGNEPGITGFTGVKVGDGRGYPSATSYYAINSTVVPVVQTTVGPGLSVTTTATVSGFTTGDPTFVVPTSSLSTGIAVHAWFTGADTLTVEYHNISGSTKTQIATDLVVTSFKR